MSGCSDEQQIDEHAGKLGHRKSAVEFNGCAASQQGFDVTDVTLNLSLLLGCASVRIVAADASKKDRQRCGQEDNVVEAVRGGTAREALTATCPR